MKLINFILKFFGYHKNDSESIYIDFNKKSKRYEIPKNIEATAKQIPISVTTTETVTGPEFNYVQPKTFPIFINSTFKKTPIFSENITRIDKGLIEDYFYDFAYLKLGKRIRNDVLVHLSNHDVTPDFAIIDPDKDVYIIVEIDEPYSIDSSNQLSPTHFLGKDDERNKKLIQHGWSLIRFSEEQIARNPENCILLIEDLINGNQKDFKSSPCWTFAEAQTMISENYRNSYLPIEFKGVVTNQRRSSYRRFPVSYLRGITTKNNEQVVVLLLSVNIEYFENGDYSCDDYSCYIKEDIFWQRMSELKIDSDLRREKMQLEKFYRYQISARDMFLEGFGELTDNRTFHLKDEKTFVLSYRQRKRIEDLTLEEKLKTLEKYGFKYNPETKTFDPPKASGVKSIHL